MATLGFMVIAGFALPASAAAAGASDGQAITRLTARLRMHVVEGLQGISELLMYGREQEYLKQVSNDNKDLLTVQKHMSHIRGLCIAGVILLSGLTVLMALYHGAALVNQGLLQGPYLAMIALAVLAAFESVMPLPAAYQYLGHTREAARRLLDVVETAPVVKFPLQSAGRPDRYEIVFKGVSFRYTENAPFALRDISFRIPAGRHVAVIGQTGAGKSTLAHLMVRFWDPFSGTVMVGSEDIRSFSESDLRKNISLVSQKAHLFSASLRDNLQIGRSGANDADLWQALDAVHLSEFVRTLPNGLETWVGESGRLLSGGQARRLALARAIIWDAPIWVLDEPTEGLDVVTERLIIESLFAHTSGKTVLLITHRLTDLNHMDLVLVMEDGRIIEQGTHSELLKNKSRYASLHAAMN